jgi:hypothetical protein
MLNDMITRELHAPVWRLSTFGAAVVTLLSVSNPALSGEAPTAARTAIRESVFKTVVPEKCQVVLCLLSINRKAVDANLLRDLQPLGRVEAASADDFVLEHGAVRAVSKKRARIIDVGRVVFVRKAEATVEVAILATGLDSTYCDYRVQAVEGKWIVDAKATRCTL